MSQRVQSRGPAFNDHPFTNAGASLYVTIGNVVQYRNLRMIPLPKKGRKAAGWIKGAGGNHDIANSVTKTARVASLTSPSAEFNYSLPAALASQTISVDVRTFDSHVENETDNFRTSRLVLDGSRDPVNSILGTATLLSTEIRDSGIVRLRFEYHRNRNGVQPTTFTAIRTAGPSSPANASTTYDEATTIYTIDTPTLSDSSAYTYKIQASNGAVTADILTGIMFTADASGPTAPTAGTALLR